MVGTLSGSFLAGNRPFVPRIINPPNTLSGIATESDLVSYFGPAPGTAFRLTSTGISKATSKPIAYAPRIITKPSDYDGEGYIITKTFTSDANLYDVDFLGGVDDGFYIVPMPWDVSFLGKNYNTVYVGTNSYITFDGGSVTYSGLSYAIPALPKILITSADNSLQLFKYAIINKNRPGFRVFLMYFEGVNGTHYIPPGGSGKLIDDPHYATNGPYNAPQGPMIWEMWFYEMQPNVIDLHVIANSKWVV